MRRYLFVFLCFFYSTNSSGQRSESHLIAKYSQNDGLSSYNVRSIVQDPLGFMWIATQDGLNLFDGKTFVQYNYNMENGKKLLASDVRSILADPPRHLLWVLTNTGGINSIDYFTGNVIDRISTNASTNDDWNITMAISNNKLWVGCMTGLKIYNISHRRWEKPPRLNFHTDGNDNLFSIRTLQKDNNGNIWAFVNHYGIIVIDSIDNSVKGQIGSSAIEKASDILFTGAAYLANDNVLVGTNSGLRTFQLQNHRVQLLKNVSDICKRLDNIKISAISEKAGYLYISDDVHIYKVAPDLKSYLILSEFNSSYLDNWLNEIYVLYADRGGNLWVGCKQGLALLHDKGSPFTGFSNRNYPNSGLNHVYTVLPDKSGSILVGQETGLVRFDSIANKFSTIEPSRSYNFLWNDGLGNTIVSANDGLYLLRNNILSPITSFYPELMPIANAYINSIERLGDTAVAIGSDNDRGIFLWNHKRRSLRIINNQSFPIKLRSNIVNRVFFDHSRNLWVLSDRGIDIIDSGFTSVKALTIQEAKYHNTFKLFFDIVQIKNSFWLAAYGYGIIQIDRNGKLLQWLNSKNGLCNDGVYKLFSTGMGALLVTTNNGLSLFDYNRNRFTNYFEQDGLHSNGFEEACGTTYAGKIYAGGLNGFSIVDPALILKNTQAPLLYIDHINIETGQNSHTIRDLRLKEIDIPGDALQTSIFFSGLNYADATRVVYQYKIDELNSKWIGLGNQNFISIIGLNPGTYQLSVRSANESGLWNPQPAAIRLVFLPKWYQTWLFKIGVLLIFILLIHSVYQYRIKQIRIQQSIRREIASDLHDDLGGTLNTIKIFSHMAIDKVDNRDFLKQIGEHAANATVGLRDMLWVLEEGKDTLEDLVDRILKFTSPIAEANHIRLIQQIDPQVAGYLLSKAEKRNLLLISKEAITNALKYAGCSMIFITAGRTEKSLNFTIRDDGSGFNPAQENKGYGLYNMQHRASQITFDLRVISAPGNGTIVRVTSKK